MSFGSLDCSLFLGSTTKKLGWDYDTDPGRCFDVKSKTLCKKDRQNPNLLKSILYDEKITNLSARMCLPTVSSALKNKILHPGIIGHDVNCINIWINMPHYDNHFLKAVYDKQGNTRDMRRACSLPAISSALDVCCQAKSPPIVTTNCASTISHHPFTYTSRLSYRQQWRTNQRHHDSDFKKITRRQF